jgi:Holliday junction resolvasome RuvABC endonuclease subunit
MKRPKRIQRLLAIDPTSKGFGYVVLESPDRLVDWGVRRTTGDKNYSCLRITEQLIDTYQPDRLVIEDTARRTTRRCKRVRNLLTSLTQLAARRHLRLSRVFPRQVRMTVSLSTDTTKHQLAAALATRFPELGCHVPPVRKPWMSEDIRFAIFDALGNAVTVLHR